MGASVETGDSAWVEITLVHRFGLFLIGQAVIAVGYALTGHPHSWQASAAWWPITAALTNVVTVALLRFLTRREGLSYRRLIGPGSTPGSVGQDLLAVLGVFLVSALLAILPNLGLARLLFGNVETPVKLLVQPLPRGVAFAALFLFPVTIGFAELPVYYAYLMPRLAARWSSFTLALLVTCFWHAAQHVALPFIPDLRFVLWRLGMFFPLTLLLGLTLHWRPRLLPYLMVWHALLDFSAALMVWQVSVAR